MSVNIFYPEPVKGGIPVPREETIRIAELINAKTSKQVDDHRRWRAASLAHARVKVVG